VFVFANSEALLNHIKGWAVRLDRPNERGIGRNFFTYAVKHKDASDLAKTLEQLLTGVRTTAAPQGQAGGAPAARGSSVVVDASSNMLIFQANPEEYSQLTALLQSLDKPAKSALIEVTVAELSVDNNSQLGVEWFFNQATAGGSTATGGTLGGLAIGSSGFTYKVVGSAGGSPRLLLNALAADNRATILSSPRISARNGETAVIQVGQEVPIITSQQSGSVGTNTGALNVLQTVQYRSTGVILKVKPAIHSGDQIDLDVTQEVSAAQATTTGVSSSPTIGTRKFDTKLTLRNGSTVMLGGLISEESSGGNAGIPGFKDMPLLGNLFSNQTKKGLRRELIVLITPYVLNNQGDAEAITDAFRRSLGSWAGTATPSPRAAEPAASAVPAAPAK
jgi:general secretion pathway protein D